MMSRARHCPDWAVSTSTRNFPNRLGIDTQVYLSSAELAAVAALMGKLPTGAVPPAPTFKDASVERFAGRFSC